MPNVAAYLLPALLSLGLPLTVAGTPEAGRPVFVVAAPWSGAGEAFELVRRADGLFLRGTALPWIAVAVSDAPDFAQRLRRAGAWMTINASSVAGCAKPADS